AYRVMAKTASSDGFRDLKEQRDEIYSSLKYELNDQQSFVLSGAYIKDAIAVDSIGHPIRIFNNESVNGLTAGEVSGADLVNDPTASGLQLSEVQRDELANSLASNDGLTPFNFGTNGII
ncbi:TonB-dependent receptor, partial [Pseudoalteromonas ruthenica]